MAGHRELWMPGFATGIECCSVDFCSGCVSVRVLCKCSVDANNLKLTPVEMDLNTQNIRAIARVAQRSPGFISLGPKFS